MNGPLPKAGTILDGRYELLRELGAGGMGVVFEANHQRLQRRVAIKILKPEFAATREFQIRFEREARAAALIQSPHAVRVFDVATSSDGLTYMVMELLSGNDLGAEALAGPIALSDLADWIVQACSALQEAHDAKIIHRDIKPANIFIADTEEGRVAKLLDFGISKFDDQLTAALSKQVSGTLGTPTFMSPEQIRGRKVDSRTDIWALGVVLYRILGNRWPFAGKNDAAYMASVLADPPTPFEEVRPDLPLELAAIVMKAIEKSPDDRYASADELAGALEPFGSARGPSITPPIPISVSPATFRDPIVFEETERMAQAPTAIAAAPPIGLTPGAVALTAPPEPEPTSRPNALLVIGAALLAGLLGFAGYFAVTSTPAQPRAPAAASSPTPSEAPEGTSLPPALADLPSPPSTGVAASASTKPASRAIRRTQTTTTSSSSPPPPPAAASSVPDYL